MILHSVSSGVGNSCQQRDVVFCVAANKGFRWSNALILGFFALILAACGGGGGGGNTTSGQANDPTPVSNFPTLVTSATFRLPPIDEPPDQALIPGRQRGRVFIGDGVTAVGGLTVQWIDASNPSIPVILATGLTDINGVFDIAGINTLAPANQWLRVKLPNLIELRAFPTGFTELSVGTEVAVREIVRLKTAGALSSRVLTASELATGQQSLSFLWQTKFANLTAPKAIEALTAFVTPFKPWNQFLKRLANATLESGAGDVSGLLPMGSRNITTTAKLTENGVTSIIPISIGCSSETTPKWYECSVDSPARSDVSEQLSVRPEGILLHRLPGTDGPSKLLAQIGSLPILEFAPVIGTRVIYNNPQLIQNSDPTIHAAVKITRRTYPAAPVQALEGTVQAIQIVFDYEMAVLNTATKQQIDILGRERRWFSPLAGRVHMTTEGLSRNGSTITKKEDALTLEGGRFAINTMLPLAGVVDQVAAPWLHRHVVYSPALNRVFAATDSEGGQVIELDPATLNITRRVATPGVPTRLAISNDGSRLYVGRNDAKIIELRTADLSTVHEFALVSPSDSIYNRVIDLAVDPFDAERILVLAGDGRFFGYPGAILTYRSGQLEPRDGPGSIHRDFGWGNHSPNQIAWSSIRDQFFTAFLGSPMSVYRFRADGTKSTEIASLSNTNINEIRLREVGGELITSSGNIIDAFTLAPLRLLKLDRFDLRNCLRFDSASNLCEIPGASATGNDATYVRLANENSAFLGSYLANSSTIISQCPISPTAQLSLAAGTPNLIAIGNGRILVSNGEGVGTLRCGIQIWSLRGY